MKRKQEKPATLACKGCGVRLVVCECCERDVCPAACCYRCMIYDLRESVGPLHEHGG